MVNPVSQLQFTQLFGSLLYIANKTRPDIAYVVGRLSRYTQNPNKDHWTALERVFKYLRGTLDCSLYYNGFPDVVEGYSDANWITDNLDVKSMSGYVFYWKEQLYLGVLKNKQLFLEALWNQNL